MIFDQMPRSLTLVEKYVETANVKISLVSNKKTRQRKNQYVDLIVDYNLY
jgi:hypothetical protein